MRPPVENGTRSERGLLVCYPDTAAVDWITIDYKDALHTPTPKDTLRLPCLFLPTAHQRKRRAVSIKKRPRPHVLDAGVVLWSSFHERKEES